MSRKEVPRAGLLKMVLAGKATNAQGAAALGVSPRHVQRLKGRFQAEGRQAYCTAGAKLLPVSRTLGSTPRTAAFRGRAREPPAPAVLADTPAIRPRGRGRPFGLSYFMAREPPASSQSPPAASDPAGSATPTALDAPCSQQGWRLALVDT